MNAAPSENTLVRHTATCHCGAVALGVQAPARIEAHACNCSMCERTGFLHLIVPAHRMTLLRGEDELTEYRFNTRVARHYFCRICGCRPFYVPRSNPDGFSVNARCLDRATVEEIVVIPFDGQNWEANAAALGHLSDG
ncbi:GFA family protein [Elongatibacter sediminis]|uniref:GFA family protein n=1 Tax=Elongatibacter sediminis TaxID=3119006 RepID=A0AAW9RDR9_9GAMM